MSRSNPTCFACSKLFLTTHFISDRVFAHRQSVQKRYRRSSQVQQKMDDIFKVSTELFSSWSDSILLQRHTSHQQLYQRRCRSHRLWSIHHSRQLHSWKCYLRFQTFGHHRRFRSGFVQEPRKFEFELVAYDKITDPGPKTWTLWPSGSKFARTKFELYQKTFADGLGGRWRHQSSAFYQN